MDSVKASDLSGLHTTTTAVISKEADSPCVAPAAVAARCGLATLATALPAWIFGFYVHSIILDKGPSAPEQSFAFALVSLSFTSICSPPRHLHLHLCLQLHPPPFLLRTQPAANSTYPLLLVTRPSFIPDTCVRKRDCTSSRAQCGMSDRLFPSSNSPIPHV